jgi:diaminopimelate decarboxylase
VEVGYSYKTNPLPGVLRTLHGFGAWAEVISHFELWLALALDVPPEKIVFNGPGKTPEAIELAVSRGVSIINVDNEDEIDWIARSALKHGRRQRVGVRVITSVGWSSQFGLGIAAGAAQRAFERIGAHSQLEAAGLHVHLGTGIRDIAVYARAVREVLQFARVLRQALGIEIKFFDLGGGFGVPTVRPYSEWDMRLMHSGQRPTVMDVSSAASMADYARVIAALFAKYAPSGEPPLVFFEPGRAITSSAQTLLVETLAIKPAGANSFSAICNGGKNVAMPLGYEYHELFAARNPAGKGEFRYDLFGPLCHPGDVLFKGKRLPRLEPGDVIAIMDAGAYFVPNQMNFSNPRPAAVMVQGGEATLIRSRETFEDIVVHDGVAASSKQGRQRLAG